MTFNNLPLYELTLDNEFGVQFISIVDRPAIKSHFLCFSEQTHQQFSISDPDKHIITGLAMIPDTPIYRRTDKQEFYVQFSANTIRQLAEKFFTEQRTLSVNVEHSIPTNDVVILESFFVDKERGIAPIEFPDALNGSWYISMKVNDEELWNSIKDGKLNGFSVEGCFDIKSNFNDETIEEVPTIENIEDKIVAVEELKEDIYDAIAKTIFQ